MKLLISSFFLILGVFSGFSHGFICEQNNLFGITTTISCPREYDPNDAVFCCGSEDSKYCCSVPFNEKDLQEIAENIANNRLRRNAAKITTEGPINQNTAITQEGFRDNLKNLKDKVKQKVNGTVQHAKDKVKQKAKDKVKKKIKEKLDPTGGHMNMPAILGVIFAIVIGSIVCCIICCCCCPCCLLHKRRTRGAIHNPPPGAPSSFYPNAPSAQPVTLMTAAPPGQMAYAPVQNAPYPQPYPPQPGYAQPPQAYPPPAPAPYPVPGDNPPPYGDKQMAFNPNY